jgi:arylsulfatase A-like enzyme
MYEPSIRVPLLFAWPERVPAGRVDDRHMVLNVDLAPTLLAAAGVAAPALHGASFLPLAEGRETSWRDAFLYEYYEYPAAHCVRKNRGIRTARHKLIHFFEQPEEWELYDLAADPDETVNLAARPERQSLVAELRTRMMELRRELGDVDPPGPPPIAASCDLPA